MWIIKRIKTGLTNSFNIIISNKFLLIAKKSCKVTVDHNIQLQCPVLIYHVLLLVLKYETAQQLCL